jgi:predicted O-methyltransferase YrrM
MIALSSSVSAVLVELEVFGAEHDARDIAHAAKMLNLDRVTAELIYLFLTGMRRTRILEIGTSNGYSAIWLASALAATGGQPLLTIERNPEKIAIARANAGRSGVESHIHFLQGDATEVVAGLDGPFDTIFFDADRWTAPDQLRVLLPKLTPDALLLADNALSHPAEIAGYIEAVEHLPGFDSTTVTVGKGLHVAHRADELPGHRAAKR